MNPNSGREVGPQFEFPPEAEGLERQRERSMEARPAQETAVGKQKSPAPDVPPQITPSTPATTQDDGRKQPSTKAGKITPTSGLAAHDVDLIEKHWVESAKAIVHQTKDDPYIQKKEMSKAKADYIKKRFNKTIPTDDTVAV